MVMTRDAVQSAGLPLLNEDKAELAWTAYRGHIMVADLPAGVNASAVDQLFSVQAAGPVRSCRSRLWRPCNVRRSLVILEGREDSLM